MSPDPSAPLECELHSLGLTVRPDKCTAWSPVGIPPTLQFPVGCQTPPLGMVVLGVPLGEAAYVGQERAVPPTTALDNIYAAAGVSLQQALLGLLDHPALPTTPAALLQMTLPIGKGGLGCRSLAHLARAAHLGCWAQVASTVSTRFIRRGQPVLAPAIAGVANGTLPFKTSLSDVRRDLLRSFPSLAADQVDFAAWARCSDLKAQARFSRAANERAMSHLKALLKEDGRGLSRAPTPTVPGWATHHAERKKERHYNDHPRGDHFFPCAMDIYGGNGTKWSSLLHRLALHVDARRRSRAGSLGHSSVPQAIIACYRMRLSLSLQRSQALAIHQRAGRALVQANGFRGGGLAPQYSLSDMHGRPREPLPRGRRLASPLDSYDIGARQPGEAQPQLEVVTITKIASEPADGLGRQIAVNATYISYALKPGTVRVISAPTGLRALLRGHTQRVSDMAFFSPDVHLLASAGTDGRVYVRGIEEVELEFGKRELQERLVLALQLTGPWAAVNPRVCWHPRMQDTLLVSCDKYVLHVSISGVVAAEGQALEGMAERPLVCNVDAPVAGVHVLRGHGGEITAMAPLPSLLATSSKDGTVRIWGENSVDSLSTITPYSGQPVDSAAFLMTPSLAGPADSTLLITGGPGNRMVKLWVPAAAEGMPPPPGGWHCIQTLELKCCEETNPGAAFTNQLAVVQHAGLIVLANARRNAFYVIHVSFGQGGGVASSARMDYIAEFSVTMPILSLTTLRYEDGQQGDATVQLYCVQTEAIQLHTLHLRQCSPPAAAEEQRQVPIPELEQVQKSGVAGPPDIQQPLAALSAAEEAAKQPRFSSADILRALTSTGPAGFGSPVESHSHMPMLGNDAASDGAAHPRQTTSEQAKPPSPLEAVDDAAEGVEMKDVLLTPERLMSLMAGPRPQPQSSAAPQPVHLEEQAAASAASLEPATTVNGTTTADAGGASSEPPPDADTVPENPSQAAQEEHREATKLAVTSELHEASEEPRQAEAMPLEAVDSSQQQPLPPTPVVSKSDAAEEREEPTVDATQAGPAASPSLASKKKKGKYKVPGAGVAADGQAVVASPLSAEGEPDSSTTTACGEDAVVEATLDENQSQVAAQPQSQLPPPSMSMMLDAVNQVGTQIRDVEKAVALPVVKEGKRVEQAIGLRLERGMKAHSEALYARLKEDGVKREHNLQTALRDELPALAPLVAAILGPPLEKALADSIQALGKRMTSSLEKTLEAKVEAVVGRSVTAQLQNTVRPALQEAVRSSMQGSILPAFEGACRGMLEQLDDALRQGLSEHCLATRQELVSSQSVVTKSIQESMSAAASGTLKFQQEMLEGQRKLLALTAAASVSAQAGGVSGGKAAATSAALPDEALSLQHVEETLDPTIELARLLVARKYEEAFTRALSLSNVAVVVWLCSQVEPGPLLPAGAPALSQGVLLSLIQQLGCNLAPATVTVRQLEWVREAALALDPSDAQLAPHMRPVLQQVQHSLSRLAAVRPGGGAVDVTAALRLVRHVINSQAASCK
eukprot:SM000156S02138  [mRNA]  locus=s156:84957:96262:- [translate_table: standard]